MKTYLIFKNICKIVDRSENRPYGVKVVYDEDDKSIRIDVDNGEVFDHIGLNRKQAVKMLKLLEEFILHNP